jgi:hypothetical protein
MAKKDIYELAEKANEACEANNSDTRYWIQEMNGEERYFICNNITEMDDIDEVSEKEFVSRIKRFLK